jgi:hypothetical protein
MFLYFFFSLFAVSNVIKCDDELFTKKGDVKLTDAYRSVLAGNPVLTEVPEILSNSSSTGGYTMNILS